MKQSVLIIIGLFLCTSIFAQGELNSPLDNPRRDHIYAVNLEGGIKNMTGLGMTVGYYVTPKIAVDIGFGTGLRLFKFGVRGRYLFLDNNFTPYVGAAISYAPLEVDYIIASQNGQSNRGLDLQPAVFGRLMAGFEVMSDNGFVFGLNIGQSLIFNREVYVSDFEVGEELDGTVRVLYGGGLSAAANIGFAF